MCMNGGKFLMEWQVTDKIIKWTCFPIHIQPFMNDSNSRNNDYHRVSKIHEWIWGDVIWMSGEKFLKEWQVTDKIIEWIVFQFTFNLLQMIQSQEIITFRVSKIQKWIWGVVYEWGQSFLWNDKWQIKLLSELFSNALSIFHEWLKLKK